MTGSESKGAAPQDVSISELSTADAPSGNRFSSDPRQAYQASATAFVVLFCIVGVSLWGLPFCYDFMVEQFHWTRSQVTSGNALSNSSWVPSSGSSQDGLWTASGLVA